VFASGKIQDMTPRKYEFKIVGYLPPKKGVDLSMFGKPGEAEKVIGGEQTLWYEVILEGI